MPANALSDFPKSYGPFLSRMSDHNHAMWEAVTGPAANANGGLDQYVRYMYEGSMVSSELHKRQSVHFLPRRDFRHHIHDPFVLDFVHVDFIDPKSGESKRVSGNEISQIFQQGIPGIEAIFFYKDQLDDATVLNMTRTSPSLQVLSLSRCTDLSDMACEHLAASSVAPQLKGWVTHTRTSLI